MNDAPLFDIEWQTSPGLVSYEEAVTLMEARVAAIVAGDARELIWFLQHPPLYTAGTSAREDDLLDARRFPVHSSGRGGEYTYHGPGHGIAYVMLDLNRRKRDVRAFVSALEAWVLASLAEFNIHGETRKDRVGVWVKRPERPSLPDGSTAEDKIAAIGIRLRKWVSFHGISINVEPDLDHYSGIVPCGIKGYGVTSLIDLGLPVTMDDLDLALKRTFEPSFAALKT